MLHTEFQCLKKRWPLCFYGIKTRVLDALKPVFISAMRVDELSGVSQLLVWTIGLFIPTFAGWEKYNICNLHQ